MSHPTKEIEHTANIFLLLEEAFAKNMESTDERISAHYVEEGVIEGQYQASIDKWQQDAAKLPDAGNNGKVDASYSINGAGIGTLLAAGIGGSALLVAAGVLFGVGAATSWLGIGLVFMAIAAVIIGVTLAIMYTAGKHGSCMTELPEHVNYDTGLQNQANTLVQRDQSMVQQLQNAMNKLMSQFITPANDTKAQDANMIQGAIQWLKAMVWSQGAA